MLNLNLVYKIIYKWYGSQGWWPLNGIYSGKSVFNNKEKFEICIGTILTQNTSWSNVEKTLIILRKNNILNIENLRLIDIKKLAEFIKSSGYNNQKARKIKEFINFLDSGKEINRENLLNVWGIGKETADSILLYAYNKPYFVIDSYTKRTFSRLGFCKEDVDYGELQENFHRNLNKDFKLFNEYHALIVKHAKTFCKKNPKCNECPLNLKCNYYKKNYESLINK